MPASRTDKTAFEIVDPDGDRRRLATGDFERERKSVGSQPGVGVVAALARGRRRLPALPVEPGERFAAFDDAACDVRECAGLRHVVSCDHTAKQSQTFDPHDRRNGNRSGGRVEARCRQTATVNYTGDLPLAQGIVFDLP